MDCCHQHIRHSSACSCNSPPPILQSIFYLLLQHYTTPTSPQFPGSTSNACCLDHSQHHKHNHPEHQQFHQSHLFEHQSQTKCLLLFSLLQRIDLLLQSSSQRFSSSPSSATSLTLRHLAARTIQARFRVFLLRRSRAFRHLNDLPSDKSLLAALKSSFPTHKRLDFLSFSREAMCLIRRLETTRGYDKRTRDIKSLILGDFAQFVKQVEEVCLRRNEVSSLMLNSLRIVWNDGKSRLSYVGRESEGVGHEAIGSKHCNLERDEKQLIDDLKARIERIHQMSEAVENKGGYKWVGKGVRLDLNGEHELQSSAEKPFRFIQDENATMLYNFDEYQKEPMSTHFSNAKKTKDTVEKQRDNKKVENDGEENHAEPTGCGEDRDEENGDNDGVSEDNDGKGSNKKLSPRNVGNAKKTEDSTDKLHAYGERLESLESDVEENLARSVKRNEDAENEDETESEGCEDEIEIENEGCEYENETENKGFEDDDETERGSCEDEIESGDCESENGIENEGCEYENEIGKRVSKTRMKLKVKVVKIGNLRMKQKRRVEYENGIENKGFEDEDETEGEGCEDCESENEIEKRALKMRMKLKVKVVKSVNLRMKRKRRVEYGNGIENKGFEDEDETEGESCDDEIESEDCESEIEIENDGCEYENEVETKGFEGESCEDEIEGEDCESENESEEYESENEIESKGCEEDETESEGSEDDDEGSEQRETDIPTENGNDEGSEQSETDNSRSPWGNIIVCDNETLRKQRERYLKNMVCYNCGGLGHMARDCYVIPDIPIENGDDDDDDDDERTYRMRYMKNVVCFSCGNRGHIARNCSMVPQKRCTRCGGFGHAIQVCGVKLDSKGEGSEQRATDIPTENDDDERNKYWRNVVCYKCRNRGHIANNCTVFV